jgi:hypothetical protein
MSATLKLTRETPFAIDLRRGVFDISVDGKTAGSIESHKTVEYRSSRDITPAGSGTAVTRAETSPSTPPTARSSASAATAP